MDWQKWFSDFPEWIAYFSPEIYLDESLWTTAGGLGIITHSAARAAYRLHVPLLPVTIRWREGFCYQKLDPNGNGMTYEYVCHSDESAIVDTGVRVKIQIGGNPNVLLKVGIVPPGIFGTPPCICLDADISENDTVSRENTKKMYYGDAGQKLAQMIVLGIGGVRALRALKVKVKKYHLNDPHCTLATVELLNEKMGEGLDFEQALAWVKNHKVFTTHTPTVIRETYDLETMIALGCFPDLNQPQHLTREQVVFLGRNPINERGLSLIAFCLRTSGIASAVSKLHAQTSRQMLSWVKDGCPIVPVTNGVDVPYWQLPEFAEAKTPEVLREAKLKYKTLLFGEIQKQYSQYGIAKDFKPPVLTTGWGRRWQDYKRPWFARDMNSNGVQGIISGKPHPSDSGMVALLNNTWQDSKAVANLAVLPENGYGFKKRMKAGVDLWLLTSRRPWEACEDCFMSAMLNGSLIMASRDGGPLEISPANCFLYGTDYSCSDVAYQDYQDLEGAKQLLPKITRLFYDEPQRWDKMTLEAKEEAENKFSAERMVREYVNYLY